MGVVSCGTTMLDQGVFQNIGAVTWDTTAKTGNFTAVSGNGYFINTTSASITVTLPAGSAGAIVAIQDYNNNFGTNSCLVDPNGTEKINGGVAGGSISIGSNGQGVSFIYVDSTVGWRSVIDNSFSAQGSNFVAATGGTITTVCTDYKVHTFTSPGTFTVTAGGSPAGSDTVDYLVVAGGGSGGSRDRAGGGGAGGYRFSNGTASGSYSAGPGPLGASALPVSVQAYPITIGAGASANPPASIGNQGSASIFSTITSAGGGAGGGDNPDSVPALAGGSGGGRGVGGLPAGPLNPGGSGNTPPVSPPQGNNGGAAQHVGNGGSGGGGGAGAAGGNGNGNVPGTGGVGGNGLASSITGSPVTRGGGGGGGGDSGPRPGGSGGGGAALPGGGPGTANTGGGGGGTTTAGGQGGNGGSGIVILRYKFQ